SGNTRAEPSLRMQAIGALLTADPKISAQHFNLLFEHLQPDKQAPLRQQAATTLSQAELSEDQLLKIATGYRPQADAFITPRLVPVFEGATTSEVGKALARTLASSRSLDSFDEQYLRSVFSAYPADVQPQVDELIAKLNEVKGKRLERLQAMEKRIPEGNIERGRKLFFGKAACYTCHTVGPEGGTFGPDLTSIQR